jgi:hypothetical protein
VQLSQIRAAAAKHIHLATEKNTTGLTQWEKKGTQAMHLPGQKQRRTTDAATMQEKETLVRSPGQKMHSNSHTQKMIKLGQNRAKNQPQGRPWRFKNAPWAAKPP